MDTYDIVTVGGGVGGSVLAKVMAERGRRVLIIERQAQFKDRVRGEFILPWGADALRVRVLPLMEADPFLLPDTQVAGPDLAPPTEEHRVKLFGQCRP
jgi:flavin-dependent dehydrogenase